MKGIGYNSDGKLILGNPHNSLTDSPITFLIFDKYQVVDTSSLDKVKLGIIEYAKHYPLVVLLSTEESGNNYFLARIRYDHNNLDSFLARRIEENAIIGEECPINYSDVRGLMVPSGRPALSCKVRPKE